MKEQKKNNKNKVMQQWSVVFSLFSALIYKSLFRTQRYI